MIDINQYLEETNTVLLTKQAFENLLKETTSVVEKLEDIKAEFDNDLNLYKNEYDGTYNCSLDYIKGIITCKTIIDKHIKESKGE